MIASRCFFRSCGVAMVAVPHVRGPGEESLVTGGGALSAPAVGIASDFIRLCAILSGRLTCHQPGPRRLCRVSGVHGEMKPGSTFGAGRVTALFGAGEATTEYLGDLTGGLGGRGDDTHLGAPCRG